MLCGRHLDARNWITLVLLLLAFSAPGWGQSQDSQATAAKPAEPPGKLTLELRVSGGQTVFHLGEIIAVELAFSSTEHRKYWIMFRECFFHETYKYNVEPPAFVDRVVGYDAAQMLTDMTCGGPSGQIDLTEKPFVVRQTLNDHFRMDTPGKYRISVTSRRVGQVVTSNTVELEILPADPAWERKELERGFLLMESPRSKPEYEQGCRIVRFLGTDAAAMEMARDFGRDYGRSECDRGSEVALISARDRAAVLEKLEAGLGEAWRPIPESYLRTLAIVSLYHQHPEWYPTLPKPGEREWPSQRSGLWSQRGAVAKEELRYAKLLAAAVAQKNEDARSLSLMSLLYLGASLTEVEMPEEILSAAREQLPGVFRKLLNVDQEYVLRRRWLELKSPAMLPVLKEIVEEEGWRQGPRGIALQRMYEMAPEQAKPYMLRELRSLSPTIPQDVLGLLPEQELPELDAVMLERLKQRHGDGASVSASYLLQRYASAAIEADVLDFFKQNAGHLVCETQANLLAYFLRVDPARGSGLLREGMESPAPKGCREELLRRLARIRMSPEVEQAALSALDDAEPRVVQGVLEVLQSHASKQSREPLLEHFRQWHEHWQPRAGEVTESSDAARIETTYLDALSGAQAWLPTREELEALKDLCVSKRCRERAEQTVIYQRQMEHLIQMADYTEDETVEHFGLGSCYRVGDMERLKEKLLQYPKGSAFQLDARFKERQHVQRVFAELKPWMAEHGYGLTVYSEPR